MKKFIRLQEHYCPFLEKNVVIQKEIIDDLNCQNCCQEKNICLNSHECKCKSECKNRLLDLNIMLK